MKSSKDSTSYCYQQQDTLVPSHDSPLRKSTLWVATFNLVATIVGGGVLSLPLAFKKCGIVFGTILIVVAALITERSLFLLCMCARQTGVNAYGEVGRMAFGRKMETFITLLLFIFLLFVLIAYMVLLRDIWTPFVGLVIDSPRGDVVLLGVVLLMAPFLVQKELYALRYHCYMGFASISVLCAALCHHAIQKQLSEEVPVLLMTSNVGDTLFALPIIMLSFLSTFNILPIQSGLINPTRPRVRSVIGGAVAACFLLMYLFGLAGYLCFGYDTEGNVLLNLSRSNDWMVTLGRCGCGITIMLAMAMMLLPCRDSILELLDCLREYRKNAEDCVLPSEQTPLVPQERRPSLSRQHLADNPWWHYGMTVAISLACYLGAVLAPGVAVVWSLCGSSMAFLIAFILPAACYLSINRNQLTREKRGWSLFCYVLLLFSVLGSVCCTFQATQTLFFERDT